jgi:hypothetical protein
MGASGVARPVERQSGYITLVEQAVCQLASSALKRADARESPIRRVAERGIYSSSRKKTHTRFACAACRCALPVRCSPASALESATQCLSQYAQKKRGCQGRQPRTSVLLARRTTSPWGDQPTCVTQQASCHWSAAPCVAFHATGNREFISPDDAQFACMVGVQCGIATPRSSASLLRSSACTMLLSATKPTSRLSRLTTGRRRTPRSAMLRATSSTS